MIYESLWLSIVFSRDSVPSSPPCGHFLVHLGNLGPRRQGGFERIWRLSIVALRRLLPLSDGSWVRKKTNLQIEMFQKGLFFYRSRVVCCVQYWASVSQLMIIIVQNFKLRMIHEWVFWIVRLSRWVPPENWAWRSVVSRLPVGKTVEHEIQKWFSSWYMRLATFFSIGYQSTSYCTMWIL